MDFHEQAFKTTHTNGISVKKESSQELLLFAQVAGEVLREMLYFSPFDTSKKRPQCSLGAKYKRWLCSGNIQFGQCADPLEAGYCALPLRLVCKKRERPIVKFTARSTIFPPLYALPLKNQLAKHFSVSSGRVEGYHNAP